MNHRRPRRIRTASLSRSSPAVDALQPVYVRNLVKSAGTEGWGELRPNVRSSFAMFTCLGLPLPNAPMPPDDVEGPDDIPFDGEPSDREAPLLAALARLEGQPPESPEAVRVAIDKPLATLCRELGFSAPRSRPSGPPTTSRRSIPRSSAASRWRSASRSWGRRSATRSGSATRATRSRRRSSRTEPTPST